MFYFNSYSIWNDWGSLNEIKIKVWKHIFLNTTYVSTYLCPLASSTGSVGECRISKNLWIINFKIVQQSVV